MKYSIGSKIKICGIKSTRDVEIINELKPDFAGFVIDYQKSNRSISVDELKRLTDGLAEEVVAVGVFVDADSDLVCNLLDSGIISVAQLHGQEDDTYIRSLKNKITKGQVWKAFEVKEGSEEATINQALKSPADMVVLDAGKGSGDKFDWESIRKFRRDFTLAGGINSENIAEAIKTFKPYAVDVSSGVETDGVKDFAKVKTLLEMAKAANIREI